MTNKSLSETDKSNMCLSHDHLTRNTAEVFRCNDCQIDFICSICAEKCHKGHKLISKGVKPGFMCECAVSYCKESCKCCDEPSKCTDLVTNRGGKPQFQNAWKCVTCNKSDLKFICNACKERCHVGHEVIDLGKQRFRCYCSQHLDCKAKEPLNIKYESSNSSSSSDSSSSSYEKPRKHSRKHHKHHHRHHHSRNHTPNIVIVPIIIPISYPQQQIQYTAPYPYMSQYLQYFPNPE